MRRRIIITAVILLLFAGVVSVLWSVLDWPPPRLILKYGFPPAGGPTGQTQSILIGSKTYRFKEFSPGYVRVDRHPFGCERGDILGRLFRPLGIPLGKAPTHGPPDCRFWAESTHSFWISERPVSERDLFEAHEGSEAVDLFKARGELRSRTPCGNAPGGVQYATLNEWEYAAHFRGIETSAAGYVIGQGGDSWVFSAPPGASPTWLTDFCYAAVVWIPPEDEK